MKEREISYRVAFFFLLIHRVASTTTCLAFFSPFILCTAALNEKIGKVSIFFNLNFNGVQTLLSYKGGMCRMEE
jgi:hypothetical protein